MSDLGSEVVANIVEMMVDVIPLIPGGTVLSEQGFLRVSASPPTPLFNGVLYTSLGEDAAKERARETLTYFEERNLPMSWWVHPGSAPQNLGEILNASGCAHVFSSAGMAYTNFNKLEHGASTGLEIHPVLSKKDFSDLRTPFEAFQLGHEVLDALLDTFPHIMPPRSRLQNYIGRVNGKPVSSGALYFGSGSAGIYNIATILEARGKGYGAAITSHLLRIAKEKGYESAVLISSKMGYSVYKKLGFEKVVTIDYYAPEKQLT